MTFCAKMSFRKYLVRFLKKGAKTLLYTQNLINIKELLKHKKKLLLKELKFSLWYVRNRTRSQLTKVLIRN